MHSGWELEGRTLGWSSHQLALGWRFFFGLEFPSGCFGVEFFFWGVEVFFWGGVPIRLLWGGFFWVFASGSQSWSPAA